MGMLFRAARYVQRLEGRPYFYGDDGNARKVRSTEIQIPMGQTLITLRANGFANEKEELDFATKLNLDKLKIALGD
jgi:hypothetical protein